MSDNSGNLAIRPARREDAAAVQEIYAPIVAGTPISFETDVPSVAEMASRIEAISAKFPYFVAETDLGVIGYAYAAAHKSRAAYGTSVDTTVYVAESARGRGVGRALYGALLPCLRTCGFHAAIAGITLPNAASVALHEAVGFTRVGVFREVGFKGGAFHDVGWWQAML